MVSIKRRTGEITMLLNSACVSHQNTAYCRSPARELKASSINGRTGGHTLKASSTGIYISLEKFTFYSLGT